MDEVSSFVQISMDKFLASEDNSENKAHDRIISAIAHVSQQIGSVEKKTPLTNCPVLRIDLCTMHLWDFAASRKCQRICLKEKYSDKQIQLIDTQLRKLRLQFQEQRGFQKCQKARGETQKSNPLTNIGCLLDWIIKN